MQFSIGVEYAFHTLFFMIDMPTGKTMGIKDLAKLNQLSETYLSKIFTKLRKSGIVRSMQGVSGGYELAKPAANISFWDVVEAIEGPSYLFQCAEIRQNNILHDENEVCDSANPCFIKVVMQEGEEQMRNYLRGKSLQWLQSEVYRDFSNNKKQGINDWLKKSTE